MDFLRMMELEPHGSDTWVGSGPEYPWGGLYGGQIVAQALRAAAHSVDGDYLPHSLHAYFIRRGDHAAPVRYEVDRTRDGRSFVTRSVVARQSAGAILSMSASFQRPESAPSVQRVRAPDVPAPDACRQDSWSPLFDRRSVERTGPDDPKRCAWFRIPAELPDDAVLHACALAYVSDDLPTEAVLDHHPDHVRDPEAQVWVASLDHAIWFHGRARADAFQLHALSCQALDNARGLSIGHVFTLDGAHCATLAQEGVVRRAR